MSGSFELLVPNAAAQAPGLSDRRARHRQTIVGIRITLQQHAPDRHSTAWKQSLMTPECKTMMQQDAQQQKTATSTTTKTAGQRNKLWTSAGLAALNPKFPPKTTNCPPVG